MRNIFKSILIMFLMISFAGNVYAKGKILELSDNYQIKYLPRFDVWSTTSTSDDGIVLTRTDSDSNGAKYTDNNGKVVILSKSDYEFIYKNQLITIDNDNLKYNKIVYEDSSFKEVPLTTEELEKIFKGADIIQLSDFKKKKFIITKGLIESRKILLVNNTDKSLEGFEYKTIYKQKTKVKGFFKITGYGNIKISSPDKEYEVYTIMIR